MFALQMGGARCKHIGQTIKTLWSVGIIHIISFITNLIMMAKGKAIGILTINL